MEPGEITPLRLHQTTTPAAEYEQAAAIHGGTPGVAVDPGNLDAASEKNAPAQRAGALGDAWSSVF